MSKVRRVATIFLVLSLLLVAALSIASFFSEQDQVCELLSHLRLLWILVLLVLSSFLVLVRRFDFAGASAILLLVNVSDVAWMYVQPDRTLHSSASLISVLQFNAAGDRNARFEDLVSLVRNKQPDLVALSEVNERWIAVLDEKLRDYSYRYSVDLGRSDGLAVYSKYRLSDIVTRYSKIAKRPRIVGDFETGRSKIRFCFAHPILPVLPEYRNEELQELATEAQVSTNPVILIGDLNCTPWSFYFRKLLRDGRLFDTERGYGPQCTFDSRMFIQLLPIDHCLTSSNFFTVKRTVGPDLGSDHLPVFVTLRY
ncbi:MAG: endonuclease/exonuclease/phosphatase family protein [Candidatus Obscuribacterales bacterium]